MNGFSFSKDNQNGRITDPLADALIAALTALASLAAGASLFVLAGVI
jgi:hypothetical protein